MCVCHRYCRLEGNLVSHDVIAKIFSLASDELTRLRHVHPGLDAACHDFEELTELQACAMKDSDTWATKQAQQSLEEVRLEIEQKLREANPFNATTNNKSKMGESL